MLPEMGATLKHSASTMPTMGSTAFSASISFSFNFGREPRNRATILSAPPANTPPV